MNPILYLASEAAPGAVFFLYFGVGALTFMMLNGFFELEVFAGKDLDWPIWKRWAVFLSVVFWPIFWVFFIPFLAGLLIRKLCKGGKNLAFWLVGRTPNER